MGAMPPPGPSRLDEPAPWGARPGVLRRDDELLVRAGQGDVGAFGELLSRHQGAVYRYCWRIFRNHHTAEDLAQEFFVKLFRNASRYVPEGHFTTYMYRVLTNLCFDALRRKKRRRLTESLQLDPVESEGTELEPVDRPYDLDSGLVGEEARDAVHGALTDLPFEVRKCVELREFEGLSYREIARVLDLSLTEVKVLLHRGRKLLARRLAKTPVGRAYGLDRARPSQREEGLDL
jgi:RNA polymerase sigma-70 factor (ECF subfamily)